MSSCDSCGLEVKLLSVGGRDAIHEEIELPKIKKQFTDLEKEKYIKESISIIRKYFDIALKKLEESDNRIKTYLGDVSLTKFIVKIYLEGNLKSFCKIWIGYDISSKVTICYIESNTNMDYHNDNFYNDYATIEEDGKEIFFKISMMSFGNVDNSINRDKASAKDLAIHLWKRFIKNLN